MRLVPADVLKTLYVKSDWQGAWRTLAHAALLALGVAAIHASRGRWWLPVALLLQGVFLVSLFAAMHEAVHGSAFRTRWLNDVVAWLAGFGILFNATYYRQFHFAHHRHAQDPRRDPELLTSAPPRTPAGYWWRAIGVPYWKFRVTNLVDFSLGRFDAVPFIPSTSHREIVSSVRWMLAALIALAAGSIGLGSDALL
jgi:fatty acid desaturase